MFSKLIHFIVATGTICFASIPRFVFALDITYPNPLAGRADNLFMLAQELVRIGVMIGVPLLVVMLVVSGALFVFAQGNDQKLLRARKVFLWTVLGGVFILGAWVFAMAIRGTVEELGGVV